MGRRGSPDDRGHYGRTVPTPKSYNNATGTCICRLRIPPAVAAGLEEKAWGLEKVVEMTQAYFQRKAAV